MFKWLTRNDGRRRIERAKRRIASPRASVFTEFAIVMPVVAMICSAMIEIVGFWDAQVMANHAAWQVGRIVMVRGSDGLVFSSSLDKKSKTGIKGSKMPDVLKKMLGGLDTVIKGANKFNNRGNIATMFLMSTCGIGYFGASPGQTLSDGFTSLCKSVVTALTEDIPKWIKDGVKAKLPTTSKSGDSGIGAFVQNLVNGIVDKMTEWALKPIANGMQKLLQKAFDSIFGKDGAKIDSLFSGKGAAARYARQMYGAASRIARAKDKTGREVLEVTDMDDLQGGFLFAKNSNLGRLVYPQVYDKEGKSDGYFVTNAHGWPANNGGLAMVHVEVNWPYESGWLFPVVSGYGAGKSKAPVAKGHSMVFPQPDIQNEHLYSEGASAYDEGSYTNNAAMAELDDLAKEMKNYLKFVKFGMKYRICAETITLGDDDWYAKSWKRCIELKEMWGLGKGECGGDYGSCWSAITDGKAQDAYLSDLNGYFSPASYRYRDYFYWDGEVPWEKPFNYQREEVLRHHRRYMPSIAYSNGNSQFGAWFAQNKSLTCDDSTYNWFVSGQSAFLFIANGIGKNAAALSSAFGPGKFDSNKAVSQIIAFASRNKVNVPNMVKWTEGADLAAWTQKEKELQKAAEKADKSFAVIKSLIEREIHDIEDIENGNANWTGDEGDPVYDPSDEAAMKDPKALAKKAREKWATMKKNLKKKLGEVDAAAVALRDEWNAYVNAANKFKQDRRQCVVDGYVDACIKLMAKRRSMSVLDAAHDASFKFPKDCVAYDIVKSTADMRAKVESYMKKADDAYQREIEYGALLGLASASRAEKEGKSIDQIVDAADGIVEDKPGSLSAGSDTGKIIDKDRQEYSGGEWKWK